MSHVSLIYNDAMLGHAPAGFDPNHPEWTDMVKRRLGRADDGGMEFTHPERPERLEAITASLGQRPLAGIKWVEAPAAKRALLELVHTPEHVDLIESYRGKRGWLHHDTTAVSENSADAAAVAAGAACAAVDAALGATTRRAFALSRPPGHHAHAGKARGFCLYNNVAIAAAYAQQRGVERVLIVDWDAHHGNGTQHIVRGNRHVMHFDLHAEAPVYPGTGALFDTGGPDGCGTLINVPVPPQTGDAVMIEALDDILTPAAIRFRPQLILVSAGFDGHHADLLLAQTEQGFAVMTARLLELAELLTDGRIAFVLEGGYREALSVSVRACVEVMAGGPVPALALGAPDPGRDNLTLAAGFHNRSVDMAPRSPPPPDTAAPPR